MTPFALKVREPLDMLRIAVINYLATDGSHGVWNASAHLLRKARLIELIGGEALVKERQQRDVEEILDGGRTNV